MTFEEALNEVLENYSVMQTEEFLLKKEFRGVHIIFDNFLTMTAFLPRVGDISGGLVRRCCTWWNSIADPFVDEEKHKFIVLDAMEEPYWIAKETKSRATHVIIIQSGHLQTYQEVLVRMRVNEKCKIRVIDIRPKAKEEPRILMEKGYFSYVASKDLTKTYSVREHYLDLFYGATGSKFKRNDPVYVIRKNPFQNKVSETSLAYGGWMISSIRRGEIHLKRVTGRLGLEEYYKVPDESYLCHARFLPWDLAKWLDDREVTVLINEKFDEFNFVKKSFTFVKIDCTLPNKEDAQKTPVLELLQEIL